MKLKVCGLKHEHNIKDLIQLPIDYIGFIFYKKSPRFVEENLSFDFVSSIPKYIKKTGVFVNESSSSISDHIAHYDLDMVQLHGNESPELCAELKPYVKVMKAFQIQDDYLDAFGDAAVFGKDAGGDIKQNKKTFLLIRALETANPEQLKILKALLTSDVPDKVDQVLAIFKACKVDAWAEALKQKYMQEAFAHLEAIAVVETRKKPLIDLANYLMNRIQ
jgi:hypothetical protein